MIKNKSQATPKTRNKACVFEAGDTNIERYMKVGEGALHAIQCMSSMMRKKRAIIQTSLAHFFRRVDRTESSKEPQPMPSKPSVNKTVACPLSPISNDLSSLPPPTSFPFFSQVFGKTLF